MTAQRAITDDSEPRNTNCDAETIHAENFGNDLGEQL